MNLLPEQVEKLLFSGRPGGNRNTDGTFNNLGSNGNWWSSAAESSSNAINRQLNYNGAVLNRNSNAKANGFSVRCCKDYDSADGKPSALFAELYKAYMDARRCKRNTINQLKFERNLEAEILRLENELLNRSYEIKPSVCFINEIPVKREIIAADFRDRVIHHFICNRINKYFDDRFIYDSYSCRLNKGALFGIKRVQKFLKSCSSECWVLRLDIQGFFMAIDREILFNQIINSKDSKNPVANDKLSLFLINKIVFNEPLKNALFKSPPSKWDGLPKDKSLKFSNHRCGLPIGNLTSQIFANIYLNPLDHFVKRELKIKRYGRYVDDMVLMHSDKQILLNAISQIREFLSDELKLTLHPRKICLQQAFKGFNFLGARVSPFYLHPGKRIANNFRKCLFNPHPDINRQAQRVQSYLGLVRHLA
jgi:hypothetical protein